MEDEVKGRDSVFGGKYGVMIPQKHILFLQNKIKKVKDVNSLIDLNILMQVEEEFACANLAFLTESVEMILCQHKGTQMGSFYFLCDDFKNFSFCSFYDQ